MAITKRTRFEVFKRDGFKCAYCGASPPSAILEIDHIDPKSCGGKDDINNLITACYECNRGKSNVPLSKVPTRLIENLQTLKEKEEQIKEYRKYIKKIEERMQKDADVINGIFKQCFSDKRLGDIFINTTLKRFLSQLPINVIKEAMYTSVEMFPDDPDRVIRYFCGICWKRIKGA